MDLKIETNKLNALKGIRAEINKVDHILNYEFNVPKANQLASKVYQHMIDFNHKYPSDPIKDYQMANKNDPYGISFHKSIDVYGDHNRIFGDSNTSLQYINSGVSLDSNYQQELLDLINPKIYRCNFIIKQQTCTQDDINKANQYLKQHKVTIKGHLTTTPVKDIKDSMDLANNISHVAKARSKVIAKKDTMKLYTQWKSFLGYNAASAKIFRDDLKISEDEYKQELGFYKSNVKIINYLQNTLHKYRNAKVFVKYYPHVGWDDNPVSDLRPAEVSDLRKHTVYGSSFGKSYRDAMNVLDSVDFNDVDGSLDRINHAMQPIIHNDKFNNRFDTTDYYDLGLRTDWVKNAVTQDIPYQRSHRIKAEYQTDQEFAKDKQRCIAQDKKILKQIQNTGKYLNSDLMPYDAKTLKAAVSALKKDLLRTLFKVNKNNKDFDPQITVDQAHITIEEVFEFADYAKDRRYKQRAKDLIDWVAEKHPNAKISYRQLNPVGHYIYKRNINNIKKALA